MYLTTSSIRALQCHLLDDLIGRAHDSRALLHQCFTLLILGCHTEGAHVQHCRVHVWNEQEVYDLWHVPSPGPLRILVHKVPLVHKVSIAYISKQDRMCSLPLACSFAITLGSRFARPISCRGENGVHGGDPMMQYGCVPLTSSRTRLCTFG